MGEDHGPIDCKRLYRFTRQALLMTAEQREFFMLELMQRSSDQSIQEAFQATDEKKVTWW